MTIRKIIIHARAGALRYGKSACSLYRSASDVLRAALRLLKKEEGGAPITRPDPAYEG
jgi:hypothetical protein